MPCARAASMSAITLQQRDVIDDASQIVPFARLQGVESGHPSRGLGEQFHQVRADEAEHPVTSTDLSVQSNESAGGPR